MEIKTRSRGILKTKEQNSETVFTGTLVKTLGEAIARKLAK